MLPTKTIEKLGHSTLAGIAARSQFRKGEVYALEAYDFQELEVLVERLTWKMESGELRDWQNRLSTMLDKAANFKVT